MVKWIILVSVAILIGFFAIYNNINKPHTINYATAKRQATGKIEKKITEKSDFPNNNDLEQKNVSKPIPRKSNLNKNKKSKLTLKLAPQACRINDKRSHTLLVGITLYFNSTELKDEIEYKEKEIFKIMKFLFSKKTISQINAEKIRRELKTKINMFLTSGKLDDITFNAFDIIPGSNK